MQEFTERNILPIENCSKQNWGEGEVEVCCNYNRGLSRSRQKGQVLKSFHHSVLWRGIISGGAAARSQFCQSLQNEGFCTLHNSEKIMAFPVPHPFCYHNLLISYSQCTASGNSFSRSGQSWSLGKHVRGSLVEVHH